MADYTLMMADIIDKTGLPHNNIALVRHTLTDHGFKKVWKDGMDMFEEYQKIQPKEYFHGKEYIFSFIGETKTTARFLGVYHVKSLKPLTEKLLKPEYLTKYKMIHNFEKDYYFDLVKLDILTDLIDRLVIDYVAVRNIVNCNWNTIANKPVIGISSKVFTGYENILWRFSDLEKYIAHKEIYEDLYTALSSVNGVYLIVDTKDHKQYVGSASGDEGIWGRWSEYLKTRGTGGNIGLKEHLNNNPGRYKDLQFTILETFPKTGNDGHDRQKALDREDLYKRKLQTRYDADGLNLN